MTPSQIDHMVVCMARAVPDGAFVGVGLGTPSALVAAMVATRQRGGHVLAGGALDIPPPVDRWIEGPDAMGAAGHVPHLVSMDWAESQTMTLQFFRPAQIDGQARLNTSRLGPVERPRRRFPGGLATADVPQLLTDVIVYLPGHRARATPEAVDFVTGHGQPTGAYGMESHGVVSLVTDRAVITWSDGRPILGGVHPWTTIDEVVDHTGFLLDTEGASTTAPPTDAELAVLDEVDPNRIRDRELGRR